MKKIVMGGMVCFFAWKASAQTVITPAKDIDKMVLITNLDYDMGRIPSHRPLEFNVTIKNISTDTVVVKEVKAGCGCTTPKYRSNEKILPGKSTYITLGFNGDATGDFIKTADIFFNDGTLFKQVKFHGVAVVDSATVNKVAINR
jgi:hypothetical protein